MDDTRTGGLSLGSVIFLVAALLVLLAVGIPAVINYQQGAATASSEVAQALSRSASTRSYIERQRERELELLAVSLATEPYFVSYVDEAMQGSLFGDVAISSQSINDQLIERRNESGFDLAMVFDTEGALLGHSERSFDEEWFDESPQIATVLDTLTLTTGLWQDSGQFYQFAVVPMDSGEVIFALLGIGLLIDQAYIDEIKRVTGAEQVLLAGDRVVASTLPLNDTDQLIAQINMDLSESDASDIDQRLQLPSGEWALNISAFSDQVEGLTAISLISVDRLLAAQKAQISTLLFSALGALALGLVLSLVLARWIARPVSRLADAAARASAGDYQVHTDDSGTREVRQLAGSFDRLLQDLRDKQDMEEYVADLSRYLPDPTVDHSDSASAEAAMREPERATLALIGLDFMRFDQHIQGDASQRIRSFQGFLAQAAEISHGLGGRLESIYGHRAVVGFSGDDAVEKSLMFAAHMVSREARQQPSMALVYGDVDHGVVRAGASSGGVVLGKNSAQLDQLLQDASVGQLLMSPAARERVTRSDARLELTPSIQRGRLSGKKYYALSRMELTAIGEQARTAERALETTRIDGESIGSMPGMEVFPGDILADRYDLLSVLGRGGMGRVYKAWDKELQDFVAVKTLLPEIARNTQYLEQLKDEIKLARKITHVNVVRTYDFGSYQNMPYITMEYVRGMTLRYLMKQRSKLPFSAALRICRQVCAGLQVAHEQAVVHRDLKPENVILEANGNAKLMDFGLAGPVDKLTSVQSGGLFMGTVLYAPPEQMTGSDLTPASDVYAFGVMMYELFLGKKPFDSGAEMLDVYQAKMSEEYIPPVEHWSGISDSLSEIITTCLRHEASMRYRDASQLLRKLLGLQS